MLRTLTVVALLVSAQAFGQQAGAQTGTIQGQVTDTSGAVIPGASVTVTGAAGAPRTVSTDATGVYTVNGVTPGNYSVRITTAGFAPAERQLTVVPARTARFDASLQVQIEAQQVTVQGESQTTVSTDPTANVGAIVLRGQDLEALSDDPDELAEDLQALAGPSVGPNGGQIFVDGFSGAQLPPKSSIREVRINQNPFSAEYDRLGFGRIEILTKPGTDKVRGSLMYGISDTALNARNPYIPNKPDFRSQLFDANLGGPLGKRASYFLDVERRNIDENAILNPVVVNPVDFTTYQAPGSVPTPQRRTSVSPRIDYQLSSSNTLVGRYHWYNNDNLNSGLNEFTLPDRARNSGNTAHVFQITDTQVLSATAINETRLQYSRTNATSTPVNYGVAVNVLQSFNGGGNPTGVMSSLNNRWELQNITSLTRGSHTLKIGGRLRYEDLQDTSPADFAGTFTFGGGIAPVLDANNQPVGDQMMRITSIERYRRTLLFQDLGYTPVQIAALGGGATQFSIAAGNPTTSLGQWDVGLFAQDDWRVRPNFTLSLGLRWETQNYIHDRSDFGPRVGFAYAPGSRKGKQGKTVIRGGFGMFYDRVDDSLTLDMLRYNGINQQQYIIQNPLFYPNVPPITDVTSGLVPQTIRRFSPTLRAPYIMQAAIGVERQLPHNTTAAVTFTESRGVHMLRSRALPIDGVTTTPGDLAYFYESSGFLKQSQMIVNVNSRFSRRVSIFSYYVLNHASNDTDGASSFPANEYDLSSEWGRANNDIRHRFMLGGAITAPWNVRLSPFIIAHSGDPFNITTGLDNNGDTIFTDRPAFATVAGIPSAWGMLNPNPLPGQQIIPRNWGEGPAMFTVNLRVSRTLGFGERQTAARGMSGGDGGGGRGGRGGWGGGRGGPGGMRMGGGPGGGMFGDTGTSSRYNLTLSVSARNLLNTVNPADPVGTVTSPLFGQSIALAGGFGPGGSLTNNRRLEFQLRFSF